MKNLKKEVINWQTWPNYDNDDEEAVIRVIRSNQLFAATEVKKFEDDFSKYLGINYSLGVGNATQGLHLALAGLNIGLGDEVIVTPYSWISTASCVLMQNAVPIFIDIESKSFGINPKLIKEKINKRTKAIIVVHMLGYPCKIREIAKIAKENNIHLIEDASHAYGAEVSSKKIGTFGDISVFSMQQRKSLSVGDGGVIAMNDQNLYEKIRKLRSFGHQELSYNYRMSEFAGALGSLRLKRLDVENNQRIKCFNILNDLFESINLPLEIVKPRKNEKAVYYAILLKLKRKIINLDEKIIKLQNKNIPIRKTWEPLYKHMHFNPSTKIPARGIPWLNNNYMGEMKNKKYKNLNLLNTEKYCPNGLLELYVHPPTSEKELKYFVANLIEIFENDIQN